MASLSIGVLRENLCDALDFVRVKKGRIVVTRFGKPVAEIVPVEKKEAEQKIDIEKLADEVRST